MASGVWSSRRVAQTLVHSHFHCSIFLKQKLRLSGRCVASSVSPSCFLVCVCLVLCPVSLLGYEVSLLSSRMCSLSLLIVRFFLPGVAVATSVLVCTAWRGSPPFFRKMRRFNWLGTFSSKSCMRLSGHFFLQIVHEAVVPPSSPLWSYISFRSRLSSFLSLYPAYSFALPPVRFAASLSALAWCLVGFSLLFHTASSSCRGGPVELTPFSLSLSMFFLSSGLNHSPMARETEGKRQVEERQNY